MLPLSLLTAAQNKPMLVELKNGETLNGHLVNCDNFMNITLREVYQTNPDGDRFWKLKECYIRGSTIKYLRVPDTLLDVVKEEQNRARDMNRSARGGHMGGGELRVVVLQEVVVVDVVDLCEEEEGAAEALNTFSYCSSVCFLYTLSIAV
ncbi:RNA processing protein [Psilocybe cubensis]|uniref:RNA processing protein n=1 Tax=Psilocybe cubensis TaxID=181762 RepID=A0ACB8HCH8_PSICU|nr:RNA processing protein [Psilocybe cubensis]KAH9485718.1 RNA processing protein [Psilocybe cubensis]